MNGTLTVREVATQLKVCPRTIVRALHRGLIKGFKIGNRWRVTEEELLRYIGNEKEEEK